MTSHSRRSISAIAVAAGIALFCRHSAAACLPDTKVTEDCRLDLVTGPVLAPSRVVALGGAYAPIAEGIAGLESNAAAPAVRDVYSHSWFDWDLDVSLYFPSAFKGVDLENRGGFQPFTYQDFVFASLGARVQLGGLGIGVVTDLQRYNLSPNATANDTKFTALVSKTKVLAGYSLFDNDLIVGGGFRFVGFDITKSSNGAVDQTVIGLTGFSGELGVLVKPTGLPFRIGATYRLPVFTDKPGPGDTREVAGLVIPGGAALPWEFELGVALQGGGRPLNPAWNNPHDETATTHARLERARSEREGSLRSESPHHNRDAHLRSLAEGVFRDREDAELARVERQLLERRKARVNAFPTDYVLVTLGLLATGPADDAISVESYFSQRVFRSGRVTTVSARVGIETELIPRWLRIRAGSYVEPSRFTEASDVRAFRQHATFGFDLRVFSSTFFGLFDEGSGLRITTVADVAPRYQNFGVSVGVWR